MAQAVRPISANNQALAILPLSADRRRRDVHHFRRFFHGQAAEKAQLDDAALLGIDRRQPRQRVVQREQIEIHCPADSARSIC